jgi:hypothetical protein
LTNRRSVRLGRVRAGALSRPPSRPCAIAAHDAVQHPPSTSGCSIGACATRSRSPLPKTDGSRAALGRLVVHRVEKARECLPPLIGPVEVKIVRRLGYLD